MLRIHQSNSAENAKEYYATGLEEAHQYYAAGVSKAGQWFGEGAKRLGLVCAQHGHGVNVVKVHYSKNQ